MALIEKKVDVIFNVLLYGLRQVWYNASAVTIMPVAAMR